MIEYDHCEIIRRTRSYVTFWDVCTCSHLDKETMQVVVSPDRIYRYADLDATSVIQRAFLRNGGGSILPYVRPDRSDLKDP